MMYRFFLYVFQIIILSFVLLSCSTETYTPPEEVSPNMIGVLGEVNNTPDSYIGVYYAGNLTTGTTSGFIPDAQVALFNNEQPLTSFYSYNRKYYKPSAAFVLQAHEKYILRCSVGNTNYSVELMMPDTFKLDGLFSSTNDITLNLTLSSSGKRNYVIAIYSVAEDGAKKPVTIHTNDPASDNFIYNELSGNTNKVFFRDVSDTLHTKIGLTDNENNTRYSVVVKSVDAAYYQYLYYSEIQSESSGLNLQLPSNISEGAIGFVGLAFIREMDLLRN